MISVEGLKVEFSARPLFHDVSFVINDQDRIALVGKNGAGKSTMLKILCGQQTPTAGVVSIPNDTTIGYLPQVMRLQDNTTVREEARKAFSACTELKALVDRLGTEMAERTDYDSPDYLALVDKFTQEHERYLMMGGDNYEAEMERTLCGLGFSRDDLERPTSEFSGGWRMRIELAKILLQKPDVLLLDEPTNDVDVNTIRALEEGLENFAGCAVVVSHDRWFLDRICTHILAFEGDSQVYFFEGSYSEYEENRKRRLGNAEPKRFKYKKLID